ncbi:Kelch repeat-containing protein [Aspergillus affinis]|uniref:Kelch repeat-containing protein n=1 Tax=Aspergillus affinis TaxID=1070780 RepID=UPI0022FE6FF3|nr:uncharacterized protein KD926_009742 [Aspergillus affinis]KAI9039300.1 hypothetical protein KD926_009742 [Aspergillus affinis]
MHLSNFVALTALSAFDLASAAASCRSGQWVNLAPIPTQSRQEHGTVAIGNSTIAILGGIVPVEHGTQTTDILQLYDITLNSWRTASPAPYPVNHPNLAVVGNTLYSLGGLVDGPVSPGIVMNWVASTSSHAYDLATDTWTELAPMPNGTERGSAIMGVHGEMVYLAGGMTVLQTEYQDAVNIVTAFNTTSGTWKRLSAEAAELPESRQHGSGAVIGDTFYVAGGRRFGQENTRDTVFELDLTNQATGWRTSSGHMSVPRGGLSGSAVGSKLYTFGGEGNPTTYTGLFNQSEVFDTVSQRWRKLAPMAVPRHGTQAATLGGRVYIPGGGLQQDGKNVTIDGVTAIHRSTSHFDAYCP